MRSIAAPLAVFAVTAACGLGTVVPAQIYPGLRSPQQQTYEERVRDQMRQETESQRQMRQLMFPYSAMPKDSPLPFHLGYRSGLQQLFPRYEGLPTYPSNVPGYGGYPGAGKDPEQPGTGAVPGLGKEDRGGRWPSWIEGGTGKPGLQASAEQSVLIRVADRVWLRDPGERAFIPLAFYDRFRFLQTGSEVEVRGKGEYQVVMHDGAGLRSRGPSRLQVISANEAGIELRLDAVEQLWIKSKTRPLRLRLPDGTVLDYTDSLLHLERRGDRIRVANEGRKPIRFTGTAGQGEIEGPRFISVWTAPPKQAQFGETLQLTGGVSRSEDGAKTTVRGGAEGRVVWAGARFQVGPGSALSVEPLPVVQR